MAKMTTDDFDLYWKGIDYKTRINLFNVVNRNERFYSGYHWDGVDTGGLPKVCMNLVKRIINWKTAQVGGDSLSMRFCAEDLTAQMEADPVRLHQLREAANVMSDYSRTTWERLKMESLSQQTLIDAAVSGDGIIYFPWNSNIEAGGDVKGDVDAELVDNTNVFFGNTSDSRINDRNGPVQPYMIIAFRKLVKDVRDEAKANKVPKDKLTEIAADSDTQYQSGDMAKHEEDGGHCTVLLKMWPQDGTIWARKSTKSVVIRQDWDTGLRRYPIAAMQWWPRKNSCHGEAEATELIPNNIAVNKLMATMILWTMLMAWPKVIYDRNRISGWSNDLTKAIPVDGEIGNAAQFLQPQGLPPQVQQLFNLLVQTTKDMAGANETALGDTSVTRTASGIAALQRAATMPLAINRQRFIQWVEDVGMIWMDYWLNKYSAGGMTRMVTIEQNRQTVQVPFNAAQLERTAFSLKVEVGASTQWSEILSVQTLDNLLARKLITFRQYLERVYGGLIPQKQQLIDEIDAMGSDKAVLFELMRQWVQAQPPEVQQQLNAVSQKQPEMFEQYVKQMIMGGTGGGVPSGEPEPMPTVPEQPVF